MDKWLSQLSAAAEGLPVLELGCDSGIDTAWLVENGFQVIATDISTSALDRCTAAVPKAQCVEHDLRAPFPFESGAFGAVVASLSLHYFDWATTEQIVSEIRRCLSDHGLLLCRVNSVHDYLHGAGQGTELEPNFYRQGARYADTKRFFTSADLTQLFAQNRWKELSRHETTVWRYTQPKIAWELGLVAR